MASQIDKFFTKKDAQEYLENNGIVADISVLKAPDKEGRLWKISNIRPKLEVPEVGTDAFNRGIGQGTISDAGGTGEPKEQKVFEFGKRGLSEEGTGTNTNRSTDPTKWDWVTEKEAKTYADNFNKTITKPEDMWHVIKVGKLWKIATTLQMGEKKLTRRYRMEFDDEKAARDYIDEQMKESTKLGQAAPEYKMKKVFDKWYVEEDIKKQPEFEEREKADEKVAQLKEMGLRTKVVPTLTGMYRVEEQEPNVFETKRKAQAYVNQMDKKGIRLKVEGTTEGKFQANKLNPNEYSTRDEAQARQLLLGQDGIRTKLEKTVEGTTIIKKLADNEFLNRANAIKYQKQLEQQGKTSNLVANPDGSYTVTNVLEVRKPVQSGIIDKGTEAAKTIKVWSAPKVEAARQKIESDKQRKITEAKIQQESELASDIKRGKQKEKDAIRDAKIANIGVNAKSAVGQIAAGGIATTVAVQQAIVPQHVTKLSKAAVQEFEPTKKLMRAPQRMAEDNLPSAPAGEKTVFGQHGERQYKIANNTQGVPKIAVKSVARGSVIGEGNPKIADVGTNENPGDRLMMNGGSKVGSIETSGSIDFTNNGSRLPKGREEEGM